MGKSLTEAWTGLEYASYAKAVTDAGLMVFIGKYAPRSLGWMRLTDKGAAIVQKWLDAGYTYKDVEAHYNGQRGCLPDPTIAEGKESD